MDGDKLITVPFSALESERARNERQLKDERDRHDRVKVWFFTIIIILIIAVVGTNMAWLAVWNSYDFESYACEYQQDGEGVNIIGDRNGVDFFGATSFSEGAEKDEENLQGQSD